MIKKGPNISNYPVFDYFIFFFQSKKFLISLIVVSSISFLNAKIFLIKTSLIILSIIFFYFFQPLKIVSYVVKGKLIFVKK